MSSIEEHHLTDPLFVKIQELIRINRESAKTMQTAAKQVNNPSLRTFFERIARDRDAQARQLKQHMRSGGEAPEDGSDFAATCRRGWRRLRSALHTGDLEAVLHEVERSEDRIKACYQRAIQEIEGRALQAILLRQYRKVVDQHEQVRELRDAARSSPSS